MRNTKIGENNSMRKTKILIRNCEKSVEIFDRIFFPSSCFRGVFRGLVRGQPPPFKKNSSVHFPILRFKNPPQKIPGYAPELFSPRFHYIECCRYEKDSNNAHDITII